MREATSSMAGNGGKALSVHASVNVGSARHVLYVRPRWQIASRRASSC